MAAPQASSRLEMLQARFQQRQLLEKEQKLLQLYDQQQLRAHQVAQRGSAGSNGSNSSSHGSHHQTTVTRTSTSTHSTSNSQGGGKVRQMFDERRQTTVKGIDKSYPLEPLDGRSRKHQISTSNVVVTSTTSPQKNGNPGSNRIVTRKTVRSEANSDVNNGKPVVTYREEVSREIGDTIDRDYDQDEFGDENLRVSQYGNDDRQIDRPSDLDFESVANENASQRHRTTAKIHLSEFDPSNGNDRATDNLEDERFPGDRSIDMPERLQRRGSATKRTSEAETRFERFKNSNAKKISQPIKQVAGNTTSFTKKRNESTVHSGTSARASTVTRTMGGETSRASSTSPEYQVVLRTRKSSPEVSRDEIKKTSGITKVSQICHKSTSDYYPRRKSEFEKSKTFRKLQLELGESSPEPNQGEDISISYGKQCKKRGTVLDANVYSPDRRSSSLSPTTGSNEFNGRRDDREKSPGKEFQSPFYRKELMRQGPKETKKRSENIETSHLKSSTYSSKRRAFSIPYVDPDRSRELTESGDKSPDFPRSREGSQSPIYRTEKRIIKNEETARGGIKIESNIETSTYTSRDLSSSSSPIGDRDFSKERRMSREKSLEHPDYRAASPSPIHQRKSSMRKEETYSSRRSSSSSPFVDARLPRERKMSHEPSSPGTKSRQGSQSSRFQKKSTTTRMETTRTSYEPDTYYTRRSSSPSANVARNVSKGGKLSREKSPEHSQGGFESPIYRRGSSTKNEEGKTRMNTSRLESSTYSSRQHASSPSPDRDDDFSKDRKLNHEKSPERPISREGFDSPVYHRGSTTKHEDGKTRMNTSRLESSTYSSRQHASSPSPDRDDDFSKDRKLNHEKSPERPISREGFDSPVYRKGSSTKHEDGKTRMNTSRLESSTYSSRQHASSPSPDRDDDFSKDRKLNHEKSPERPIAREGFDSPVYRRGSSTKHEDGKTRMNTSRLESSTYSSRQHASSPSPDGDDDFSKDRKLNHEKSPERPISREGFDSPVYHRGSSTKHEDGKTRMNTSRLESSTYSSRQHASSPSPDRDDDFSKDRKLNHEKSPERPISREGFDSPVYHRGSSTKHEDGKTRMNTSRLESSTYSSRQHASSPSPDRDDDFSKDRKLNHEKSPERPISREGFDSPVYRRGSSTKHEDGKTRMNTSRLESSTYSSRQHASSPSPDRDDDFSKDRKLNHEKSPERPISREGFDSPVYHRGSSTKHEDGKTRMNTSRLESSTYSSRQHASSPSPDRDDDFSKDRKLNHEKSPERPISREGFDSPVYRRGSSTKHEDGKTRMNTSRLESSTYSSRQHASSPNPDRDDDFSKDRKLIHEKSPERPISREGFDSPVYRRGSSTKHEDGKTRMNTSRLESSTYSSRQHASSASPDRDDDFSKDRKLNHEKSPERPISREGFDSPVYRRGSSTKHEDGKTRMNTSRLESSTYSSRQHASSPSPDRDDDFSKDRKLNHEKSPERPISREGFDSPVYHRGSSTKHEDGKTRMNTSRLESSTYSSRQHASSPSPDRDDDFSKDRKLSHEKSPERLISREGFESPIYRRGSITRNEECKTGMKTSRLESSTYSSKRRSSSPSPTYGEHPSDERRPSNDNEKLISDRQRKSGQTLRSFELVKKLLRPSRRETKTTITSTEKSAERKITLEDIEFPSRTSRNIRDGRTRSESPEHKIVKKDKAIIEPSKEDESTKLRGNERSRDTRSRTISPSTLSSRSIKETASFRAKKKGRNISSEAKNNALNAKNQTNPSNGNGNGNGNDSRRSSAEIRVNRHDTFRVNKPSQKMLKIDSEEPLDKKEKLSTDEQIRIGTNDKSMLLERIEKIRSTLSQSGRSEQNVRSKEFERTDSVESALRRFDSIGVETEHRVTVGVDETDILPAKPCSESFLSSKDEKTPKDEKLATKKSTDCPNKFDKITVAVVKARPRKIDNRSREASREKISKVNLEEKDEVVGKSAKGRKERWSITITTPRQSGNKIAAKSRPGQKSATSIVKKSKLRSEESSGRGEGKLIDGSPLCKRKLFEDSESEMGIDDTKSSVVLRTITRTTKESPGIVKIEAADDFEKSAENEPTKILRSIEDIRKSIKRESQDFKRELNKFNTVMRRDVENCGKEIAGSVVTSGIVSRVQITKTMKSEDPVPVIKIEKSIVKLPITHRVAKSPSPDIGTKRTMEGRARTTTATTTTVRRSVPSSPAKSPDATNRYGSSELRISTAKSSTKPSSSPGSREIRNQTEYSTTSEYSDRTDNPADDSEVTVTEFVSAVTTMKNNEAFAIEPEDDDELSRGKDNASSYRGKPPLRKKSSERSLTSQRQQRSPSATPLPRPTSALSTASSGSSARACHQTLQINSKSKMSTKTKSSTSGGQKGPATPGSRGGVTSAVNDGLAPCKICGRRFNSERVTLHEQICSKTATKKRKQFDATIHRVKGTELESFVVKKSVTKKPAERKAQKPEIKSNWRRKHEDFINAIRSAKQVQAHLAAGGKLSDLPPPPPSDTSDYIQCPHCGRKFNQAAAERHIPKCQTMMHNKPNSRAPPKPKR